jgi:hypothetical protein
MYLRRVRPFDRDRSQNRGLALALERSLSP